MLREHRNTKPSGINSPDQPQSPENRWNYHIRSHRMIPTAVFLPPNLDFFRILLNFGDIDPLGQRLPSMTKHTIIFMTLFICSSCRSLQGTVFCIDRQSDNLNNRLKLSDYTLDRAGNSMITDRDTVYRLALLLGNDTTGYGNWKQYYRIPFDGNRTMRLVLDGGDDPGPREYLILHDEHGKIVRYIEVAAEYGDGPRSKKIYSVLTKDSLYVYTVTTEAFLTGDDFIDDTKPATADTMKKSYHIGDLTAIYR